MYKKWIELGIVTHALNPRTREAEVGGSLVSSSSASLHSKFQLHSEILFQKKPNQMNKTPSKEIDI